MANMAGNPWQSAGCCRGIDQRFSDNVFLYQQKASFPLGTGRWLFVYLWLLH
jgi:hypothetical protein